MLVASADRVLARLTVGFAVIVAYETVFVTTMGATPGKQITGIRVGQLDRATVEPRAALRRAMLSGFITFALAWPPLVIAGNTGDDDSTRRRR